MSNYTRVLPRDLFNEAALLKCLGRLALYVTDGLCQPLSLSDMPQATGFEVLQDLCDGSIYCPGVLFWVGDCRLDFVSPLNSRRPWPLLLRQPPQDDVQVFGDHGQLSAEFRQLLHMWKTNPRINHDGVRFG